jgi:hypothetical protein
MKLLLPAALKETSGATLARAGREVNQTDSTIPLIGTYPSQQSCTVQVSTHQQCKASAIDNCSTDNRESPLAGGS